MEGLSRMFDKEFWNYAKLISGILRHGMPIPKVIDLIGKLTFDEDSINSWRNGVARALGRCIEGDAVTDEECPECHQKTVVYSSGCKHCTSCGWSKCS
jgi:ribonucleoside-diphosphate reductase alpha chain